VYRDIVLFKQQTASISITLLVDIPGFEPKSRFLKAMLRTAQVSSTGRLEKYF
jgi:hypothetical protein